jgi:uroporphyrinogen decarboxylase
MIPLKDQKENMMNSRERLLKAISNEKPDRLPCQVHSWMTFYLDTYLDGMDQWQAYEKFGMDMVIYNAAEPVFDEGDLANWKVEAKDEGIDAQGVKRTSITITTPDGQLHHKQAQNEFTTFDTEHIIKSKEDFEIFNKYWPVPVSVDMTQVQKDKDRLGDRGIMRTFNIAHNFGQLSPWQNLCFMMGTEPAIMAAMDDSQWTHYVLESLLEKSLRVTKTVENPPTDMVELGGGAASNTVISPTMFEEFCLPYDKLQVQAMHDIGLKCVYHLCGGLMKMADLVVEMGPDALETMTPKTMGGDCDLALASEKWGDKLAFIGGFDQNAGFENGTPEDARRLVRECFEATKDHGGYIIAPSDHFFNGNPENIEAFVDEAKKCIN